MTLQDKIDLWWASGLARDAVRTDMAEADKRIRRHARALCALLRKCPGLQRHEIARTTHDPEDILLLRAAMRRLLRSGSVREHRGHLYAVRRARR